MPAPIVPAPTTPINAYILIYLEKIEVNFIAGYAANSVVKALSEFAADKPGIVGSVTFDPIMCLAKTGKFCSNNPIADAVEIVQQAKGLKNFR